MEAIVPVQGCPTCALLAEQVKLLREQVAALQGQVRELRARLDQDSSNSHKPPSSDPPWASRKPSPGKPTGRKPGAQPGHEGHHRRRLPPERVDRYVDHVPTRCRHCRAALPAGPAPGGPPPSWHQVAELPEVAAVVTEHRGHARTCGRCGKATRAPIPAQVRKYAVGPRLAAALSYLAGRCHDGRRTVAEVASDLFGVPLSLGSVCNYESRTADALARAHHQALAAVRDAPVKHVDETGWKRAGRRRWLWAATTRAAACFAVQAKRSWRAACDLLGRRGGRGVITSDRHRLYDPLGVRRRQVCWAHLKRDFVKWQEKGEKTRLLGDDGLALCGQLFGLWRDFRERTIDRPALGRALRPLRKRLGQVLQWGERCGDLKAANFCRNLLKLGPALWTFARVEGVEPTNNPAERALRAAVLWRKNSFGCHGEGGCRFVERMLSVIQTLRLQGRQVLAFLCQTLQAHRTGQPLPPLIPV
jgi:transposase